MTDAKTYTVTTRKGKTFSVTTTRTLNESLLILSRKPDASDFERDLVAKRRILSPKQVAWVFVLAEWTANPRKPRETEAFPGILDLLTRARDAGKRYPKIKLSVDGQPVVLALSGAGKVNVTDGRGFHQGVWYGAIQPSGAFREGSEVDTVLPVLKQLEDDPAGVASQHGVATGNCCFCAKELTTKESRSVGYGPICAGNHGLPWGAIDPNLDSVGKEILEMGS